jgi:hypothetical protein
MPARRTQTITLVATICAAASLWLSCGVLTVADAAAVSPRVGLLPPLWLLAVFLAGAVALAFAIRIAPHRSLPLFFAAFLALPWLPVPLPAAMLIWSGPVAAGAWIAIGAAVLLSGPLRFPEILRGWIIDPRRAPIAAAVAAMTAYGAAAVNMAPVLPGGDEPHYLVITQSLLSDGDLRIENNHDRGDYRAYIGRDLKPDYLRRGKDGEIYSIHAPGISVLVAPAFALFGYPGVRLFLAFLAAIASAMAWRASWLVTGSTGAAWFGWASAALAVPVFFHSFTVYPDGVAGLLVMSGVLGLLADGRGSTRRWMLHGAALAVLPWLHTRYAILAAAFGVLLALRLARARGGLRLIGALMAVPAVSAAAWFGYFKVVYGTFDPSAPYGSYTQTALAHIPAGVTGLLFDQQFGLIANAPVLGVALVGLAMLARRSPRLVIELMVVIVPYVLAAAAYRMWWGGWSAPARFAAPVLLPLAIGAAASWAYARSTATRALGAAALLVSLLVTGLMATADGGVLAYDVRDGVALWLERIGPVVNLPLAMPSLFRGSVAQAWADVAVWAAACGIAWLALRLSLRDRSASTGAVAVTALYCFATAGTAAVAVSWKVKGADGLAPAMSQVALLKAYDSGPRVTGWQQSAPWIVRPEVVVRSLRVGLTIQRAGSDNALLRLPRVPAGTYRVRAAVEKAGAGTGAGLGLFIGRDSMATDTWTVDPAGDPDGHLIRLPVEVHSVVVMRDTPPPPTFAAGGVSLAPVSIVPRSRRLTDSYARRARRYAGGTIFFLDEGAYAEQAGFWVGGGTTASLVVAPDGAPGHAVLLVRNGAHQNRVAIESGRWADLLELAPWEERLARVPLERGSDAALVRMHADRGFRPRETDGASDDGRYLGCWVELRPARTALR